MRISRPRQLVAAAALALTLSLTTACGSGDDNPTSSSSDATAQHNDADVTFAQDMLVHHAQALDMVKMTEGRPLDPAVEQLASDIEDAQTPEIETFTGWLEQWDESVPESMPDMDHAMPGMMSGDEMQQLETTSDQAFQARWLELMIKHHEGAVAMAKTEVADGEYQPAVDLAQQIADSQAGEIDTMQKLLDS